MNGGQGKGPLDTQSLIQRFGHRALAKVLYGIVHDVANLMDRLRGKAFPLQMRNCLIRGSKAQVG